MVPERDVPTATGRDPFVDLALTAPDGRRLGARIYEGEGRDVVVVAPATGVRQRFYDGFARAVQARGATAITFDYRGIGDSRNQHPRRDPARMREWGTLDIEAALRHAAALADARGGQVLWVGQSAGICFLPLAASRHIPERIVSVSGLSGHWRLMQPSERPLLWAMWYLLAPVLCLVPGYAPVGRGEGRTSPPGSWGTGCAGAVIPTTCSATPPLTRRGSAT